MAMHPQTAEKSATAVRNKQATVLRKLNQTYPSPIFNIIALIPLSDQPSTFGQRQVAPTFNVVAHKNNFKTVVQSTEAVTNVNFTCVGQGRYVQGK